MGRNYAAHAAELGNALPDARAPLLFWKPAGCLARGGVCRLPRWPEGETLVHFEGEIALVLGRDLGPGSEDLPPDPWDAVSGVAAGLDLSDRTLQKLEPQWVRAKGFADACALGPAAARPADPEGLSLTTWLDGERVQAGSSDLLLFPLRGLLRYVHGFLRLYAGDVLLTGTPAGVGPVAPGQRLRVEVGAGGEPLSQLEVEFASGAEVEAFPR